MIQIAQLQSRYITAYSLHIRKTKVRHVDLINVLHLCSILVPTFSVHESSVRFVLCILRVEVLLVAK
jgi:hypothetical protein